MAKKRRKKTKNKSKVLWVTIFFLGCIIIPAIFFYWLYHHLDRSSSTPYEEISAGSSDLKAKISSVDHAVYESLYNEGIEERDVYFSEVTNVNAGGYDWDFAELTIRVPDRETALRLGEVINKELLPLRPGVEAYREDVSGQEIVYNVFSLDLYSHRIRLSYKEIWKQLYEDLPKIAIIIDDIGNDCAMADSLMDIGLQVTLSILPSTTHAKDIAEKANNKGFEVILHLPMEPKNYPDVNPGRDALLTDMGEEEILAVMAKNLKKIPGVSGVNNHMGSCFTEKEDKMTYVLKELKKRGLFYVDSRTTSSSVGFRIAGEIGVPAAEKDVFLDNDLSYKAVKYQMDRLIGIARYSGEAIGIGHPHDVTLDVLREYADILKTEFKVVPVSELVK